ncbi:MAG: FGGY-family carbohydrate kinase [Pleomorphochaeta sp.]
MNESYYIGLDNGGTSTKAVLFNKNGREIYSASRMLNMICPAPYQTERDLDELLDKNLECISEIVQNSNIDSNLIKAVSISGHGKGLYLWGKNNKPVRNGIVSTDNRAADIVKEWENDGISSNVFNINYQKILASQPVALLKWLKKYEFENYNNIKWVFECKDYIRFRLTNEAYAELTDYSGSNLLNLSTKSFDYELLKLYGIEEVFNALPPLKKSSDICGHITKEISKITGLNENVVVAGGMFDIDSCCIAMNVLNSNNLCVIAGTWSINEYISKKPVLNHTVMMNSYYCIDDYFLIEECSPTSAGNLEWYIQNFLNNDLIKLNSGNKNIYKFCDELVESIDIEDSEGFFFPYIFGSNYNPKAKACFINLDSRDNIANTIRAVFEGIVFCHMVHIEKLLMNNDEIKTIRLAGGAANSKVWVQMFADVTNYPIEVVSVKELGALGVAMCAAVACKDYENLMDASDNMTAIGEIVYPREEKVKIYNKKYKEYKQISKVLNTLWK